MTDYSKKFRFVHAKEKRVERDRVGEIRGGGNQRKRESGSEFQFGFVKILLLTEKVNSVCVKGLNWSFLKNVGFVWHYVKSQGSLLDFTLISTKMYKQIKSIETK